MDGNQQPEAPQWRYNPAETESPLAPAGPVPEVAGEGSITWTASEFIAHHKNAGWYGLLAAGSIVAAGLIWLITKDIITAISIVAAAGLLAAFANRQPRELTYRIDSHGLQIGPKFYTFDSFRSFAVMSEGAFANISFTPLRRFAPMLTIYFDPGDETKIINTLSLYLPSQPRKADFIDRLMWRIRF